MPNDDEPQPQSQNPGSKSIWLLCLPCWMLALYALIVITVTKLAPALVPVVVSKKFTIIPACLTIASPLLWFVAMWKSLRRYFRTRSTLTGIWSFQLISGVVMVATWIIVLRYRHA